MLDCLVVGAGPAGGQCARKLARSGRSVLLIDRLPSFEANPFSSGGAPISIMEQFNLPKSVVGSHWRGLRFVTDKQERLWTSSQVGGVVLDFAKLRQFLAEEVEAHGGKVALGIPYRSHEVRGDHMVVRAGKEQFKTEWLVDATGSERRILAKGVCKKPMEAVGIEQLVEVDHESYEAWSDALSFFMGESIPHGYGWIFPMGPNQLKVGIGRYFPKEEKSSYKEQLDALLERTVGSWRVLDQHGKKLAYASGRRDPHTEGQVIAIGDAISTANPLAFEGIRFAMKSGEIAAESIEKGETSSFAKKVRKGCGSTWRLTEWITKTIYRKRSADSLLNGLADLSYEELYDLCFHYRLWPLLRFMKNSLS